MASLIVAPDQHREERRFAEDIGQLIFERVIAAPGPPAYCRKFREISMHVFGGEQCFPYLPNALIEVGENLRAPGGAHVISGQAQASARRGFDPAEHPVA